MNKNRYKQQIERLCPSEGFEERTKALLADRAVSMNTEANMRINKRFKIIIAAAVFALLLTGTFFAAALLLSPSELAGKLGDTALEQAFSSDDAVIVNESIQTGDYTVTFLGMVSGEHLSTIFSADQASYTYAAFSIEYTDGREMVQENGCPLSITPLVEGYQPWCINIFALINGAYGYVENNVYYYLLSCNDLELFADREVAMYVYEGFAPSSEIFSFDASSGEIGYCSSYTGFRGTFELELDAGKADPQAARELIEAAGFELNDDGSLKLE